MTPSLWCNCVCFCLWHYIFTGNNVDTAKPHGTAFPRELCFSINSSERGVPSVTCGGGKKRIVAEDALSWRRYRRSGCCYREFLCHGLKRGARGGNDPVLTQFSAHPVPPQSLTPRFISARWSARACAQFELSIPVKEVAHALICCCLCCGSCVKPTRPLDTLIQLTNVSWKGVSCSSLDNNLQTAISANFIVRMSELCWALWGFGTRVNINFSFVQPALVKL